jgi:organic hydroperoxide reductase OsmC/OhrA
MEKTHAYKTTIVWTGNKGKGTANYNAYHRDFILKINNKPDILCSSDIPFLGDGTRHNPEDMLLAALSSCHMLWYLHLCADNGITVTAYEDNATGTMIQKPDGGGNFIEATLHPTISITDASHIELATALHIDANKNCFIANSCNFPVHHKPQFVIANN